MKRVIKNFFNLLFPRCCVICKGALADGEKYVCAGCLSELPRTKYHLFTGNEVEKLFWGQLEIENAVSCFYYEKGGDVRKIIYELKYFHCQEIGQTMGRSIAIEIRDSGFFQGIDVIIPIPLHKNKKLKRGYNQSEQIASGISQITGIPIDSESVFRSVDNATQTRKNSFERHENVEKIFSVSRPECLTGKHILLVDDVITTGATLVACANSLQKVPNIKISVLTLAVA